MKECLNCKENNRIDDKYCRNCGYMLHKNSFYVFINIVNILLIIGIIFMVLLYIASYIVY